MSSPPTQRKRQSSPTNQDTADENAVAAQVALQAAVAMKQASSAGVVRICGTSPSECGYCKGRRSRATTDSGEPDMNSSQSYSLLGDFMTPKTYEGFVYRGWRRSGTYLYKPNNWVSCCPAFTIRLPVRQFNPTKSQRKVAKKMEQLLQGGARWTSCNAPARGPYGSPKKKQKRKRLSTSGNNPYQEQIITQLENWTQSLIQSILEENSNLKQIMQTSNLRPTFRVKAPPGKQSKPAGNATKTDATILTVCTTICAALSGLSKGVVMKDTLSQQLAEKLQSGFGGGRTHALPNSTTTDGGTDPSLSWILQNVHRHAQSGQIFCDIQLHLQSNDDGNQVHNLRNYNDDAIMYEANPLSAPPIDKLRDWLDQHGPSIARFRRPRYSNGISNAVSSSDTAYPFEVHTLPAHESALQPEVHKLYFLYQHKVHQDADPFTCDLSGSGKNANSNSVNSSGINAPSTNEAIPEDDEWSSPANSSDTGSLPVLSSSAPVRGPTGFVDTAKRMLQREYPNVSAERLQQIVQSYGSFFQFLVESPFKVLDASCTATITKTPAFSTANKTPDNSVADSDVVRLPSGTYHQQYRVAGMLVAVGVVDILHQGLSSVYLFYHPQFAHDLVPLGKYAILQEIEFDRSLRLPYYYLGYYIESCTKMRYKAEYRPSELLCPTTYRWVDAALAQRIIQTLSPLRHCCTLYYSDQIQLEHDLKNPQQRQCHTDIGTAINGHRPASSESVNSELSDAEDADDMSTDGMPKIVNSVTRTSSSSSIKSSTRSILKKPRPAPLPPNPQVEQVKMDVGVGVPVTLSMLHERGRETVRPLLEEFVKEAGHDLSAKCLVKFS